MPLNGKDILINPVDRLEFQWMLEKLLAGRPGFAFFKCQLEGELVYIFTRHQSYLGKRWPCLFIMGKGWQRPMVLSDEKDWLECYEFFKKLEAVIDAENAAKH